MCMLQVTVQCIASSFFELLPCPVVKELLLTGVLDTSLLLANQKNIVVY